MLGGLALGLVLSAAPAFASGGAEYSGASSPGLASRQPSQGSLSGAGKVRIAQSNSTATDEEIAEARKRLKKELERMRRGGREGNAELQEKAPKPAKKKDPASAEEAKAKPQPAKLAVPAIDPAINRALGKLIIMRFTGAQPSDAGPKAIRALLQQGLIAGAMFGSENIHARAQTKELMKFFWQGAPEPKPIFAISEIGGTGDGLPRIKEFEVVAVGTAGGLQGRP